MRRSMCLCVVGLLSCALAYGDAPQVGVVTGTVFDPGGAPMPGATVQLISDRGSQSVVSDAEGTFKFAFLIPGDYTVRADLSGFQAAEGNITVSAGGRADVTLQLSEPMGEEIVITGEAPLVNKFDVSGGGSVEAKELEKTVSSQRYYLALLDYFPGVTSSQLGGWEGFDVEGTTSFHNVYYVDGVDTSFERWGGGSKLRLPNVAVGHLQMTSSRAGAGYSRSMGGIANMVVKSGTNEFRGDLSATFQNLSWNEQYDVFPDEDLPDELDTTWEAAIGGPIVRDKLWFFISAADQGILGSLVLPNGDRIDNKSTIEPWVTKFNYRPNQSHSLALTVADTPTTFPYLAGAAEPEAGAQFEEGGRFATLRWSWAISDDLFLDTSVARQETYDNREPLAQHPSDPSAPAWSPAANNDITYYDLSTGFSWNYIAISKPGEIDHPRTQGNASLNWFRGSHDVKLGLDYQDTGWTDDTQSAPMILGYGYNRNLPAGFAVPLQLREFIGGGEAGVSESNSETWSLFVRDQFTVGDHWTFNLGLRLDDQSHFNDADTEVFQSTDIAPRVTAVFDVWGDSRLLLTAGGGRYYDWIPMDLAGRFNETPSGRAVYDQYVWVGAMQDFVFRWRVATAENIASNTIDPSYKDELTVGVEWAFHPNWAFKASGLYKETADLYSSAEQVVEVDGEPTVANVYENLPEGRMERTSVSFVVRRRFLDNWSMTGSYTWSDTKANCYTVYHVECQDGYGRLRAITNEDGVPLSVVNRWGYPSNHLPHVLKLRGSYLFPLGQGHTINVGGFATYQSGSRWELITETAQPVPGVDWPDENIIEYLEPAGSRKLDDLYQIDLNASWQFPISGRFSGSILLEVLNATDQQEQVWVTSVGRRTGDPEAVLTSGIIQNPRRYRALVTLSF